jgi:hypothetical protein
VKPGVSVEVFSKFDGSWLRGFELAGEEHDEQGRVIARRVRRVSDRTVLPQSFPAKEVRPASVAPSP